MVPSCPIEFKQDAVEVKGPSHQGPGKVGRHKSCLKHRGEREARLKQHRVKAGPWVGSAVHVLLAGCSMKEKSGDFFQQI